jgi:glycosyltransferase involved in cell wall biosynthesis
VTRKIGIIGHFGGKKDFFDGQTIKTKELYTELNRITDWKILKVDTFYKNINPFKLLIDTIKCIYMCDDIIILLSKNGLQIYLPLMYICSKLLGKRIYHDVIGGNDSELLEKYPKWSKYMGSFVVNWVESKSVIDIYKSHGINNAEYLPNFKRLEIIDSNKAKYENMDQQFRFCTFSRVSKEKGIPNAIEAIENINKKYNKQIAYLDIYGAIDYGFEDEFTGLLNKSSSVINYKGIVNYKESTKVLKNYFALLFPTYFYGEGFPGTILDSFASGLPVIATDWHYNAEIIENGATGIIYPNDNLKDLSETIEWAILNQETIHSMRGQCIKEAIKYKPENIVNKIIYKIEDSN